jgi:hypothetical protein
MYTQIYGCDMYGPYIDNSFFDEEYYAKTYPITGTVY